jgi:hypothetical protein
MRTEKQKNSLSCRINDEQSNALLRIGYFTWLMSGSNLVKPLLPYVNEEYVKNNSDDGLGILSAVGARFRNWVTIDGYSKSIQQNEGNVEEVVLPDGSKTKTFLKPSGIDQLQQVYYDLAHGMHKSTASFFDPSVDFKETVKAIDLLSVTFVKRENFLDMSLIFAEFDVESTNELWSFSLVHRLLSSILGIDCGDVNVCVIDHQDSITPLYSFDPVSSLYTFDPMQMENIPYDCNELIKDFDYFFDFEKHLKMQASADTFNNPLVAVPQLIDLLNNRLVKNINSVILYDVANALLCLTIIKHSTNYVEKDNIYNEKITQFFKEIKDESIKSEVEMYAQSIGKQIWVG